MDRLHELQEIYKDNSEWLKFAELKNGLLLTIVGILTGLLDGLVSEPIIRELFIIFNLGIMIICCISFVPFLNKNKIIVDGAKRHYSKKNKSQELTNIVFYTEIFLLGERDYKRLIKKVLKSESSAEFSEIENIYLSQILSVSIIASIKYYLFEVAMQILLLTLVLFVVQNFVNIVC